MIDTIADIKEIYPILFNNSPFHISLFDLNGNLIESNSTIITKLADYTNIPFKGKHFIEIANHFENANQIKELLFNRFRDLREGKVLKPVDFFLLTRKKTKIWLRWNSTVIDLRNQKLVQVIIQDITEQKDAEEKLKESEGNYRLITENANDLIRVLNDRFEIEFANEKAHLRVLGYSQEDLLGKSAIILNHPEDYTSIRRYMRKVFKHGEGTHESRLRHKDGSWIWFEIKFKMFTDEKGNTKYLNLSRNITERKKTEQKLKESEEKFRRIFESIPDLFFLVSGEGIILDYKGNVEELDFPPENYLGKTISESLPKHIIDLSLTSIRKTLESHEPQVVEFDLKLSGKIRYFEARHLYFSKDEVLVFIRDITKSKQAIQDIKESEEKFRNIAEQSFMGILIIQDGKIKYANKTIFQISGYTSEEILKWEQEDLLQKIHSADSKAIFERLQRNIEGTMSPLTHNTFRIINRDGKIKWFEDYTSKIEYQGKPANLISLVDITDKREAEQLIIEENKRLLELQDLRKDLITRVSHELKTPMTSINGAIQILTQLYMDEIGEEARKYVEIGHRGCIRLKQLIDNLLDVSRLNAKKFTLNLQKDNLIELIIDCVKDMNYLATNRQLKIKLDLPNEAFLNMDRLRIRQVLTNIISNAIKNTQKNGKIYISLLDSNEYIEILIRDTGVGLTEKEKQKLFEKFGKIERYGMDLGVDIEGSGLGLFISKEIVELHGGEIFVESEGRNKGSIFIIKLPKN
jgi:PAS domain S-box-containing protein